MERKRIDRIATRGGHRLPDIATRPEGGGRPAQPGQRGLVVAHARRPAQTPKGRRPDIAALRALALARAEQRRPR